MKHKWAHGFENYQNVKKSVAELSHSDLLSVYKSNFPNTSRNAEQILVRFNQNDLQIESY